MIKADFFIEPSKVVIGGLLFQKATSPKTLQMQYFCID
jgi:hypothetical protein